MTCHDAREALSAFLDDELGPERRREVEAHLEGCAECRRELDGLRQTVALLRGVQPARAPVGFVDRVVTAARPRRWYRRLASAAFLPLSVKVPAEATAILMVALLAVYVFERTPTLQQAARPEAPPRGALLREMAPSEAPARLADETKREPLAPRSAARPAMVGRPEPARPDSTAPRDFYAPVSPPPAASAPAPSSVPSPKAESESRAAGPPPPEADNRQKAQEAVAGARRAVPSISKLAADQAQPSADVVARATLKDREGAARDLTELVARVGGTEIGRRRDGEATIVEVLIPLAGYPDFVSGLTGLGPWQIEAKRADLPAQVRVLLRLD
jgi:hypothetical protein